MNEAPLCVEGNVFFSSLSMLERRTAILLVGERLLSCGVLQPRAATATEPVITRLPQPGRLVAIGDLHGDATAFRKVLSVAGLCDESSGRWIGGDTTLVQIGDVLDRGDEEMEASLPVKHDRHPTPITGYRH